MQKIGLVADAVADLSRELTEKHQIEVVPVKMDWPELESLTGNNTFQKMREMEKRGITSFGKTSQPSPKDFLIAFKKQLGGFEKVICITVTSKLSGTYNSAIQAKSMLTNEEKERVFVVDCLNASVGESLSTYKALDLIKEGKEAAEIAKELEKFTPQAHFIGLLSDPKWVEAAGRMSHTLADWVRKAQKIGLRPLLGMKKGKLTSVGIKAGAKSIPAALLDELDKKTKKLREQGKRIRVTITHGDVKEQAQELKTMIEKTLKGTEVISVTIIDDVLSVLTGPDAMLLGWSEI